MSLKADSSRRIRSHCLEGCGLGAKCGNRGHRTRLQWRLGRLRRRFGFGSTVAGVADPGRGTERLFGRVPDANK